MRRQRVPVILDADDHNAEGLAHQLISVDQPGRDAAVSAGSENRHAANSKILALPLHFHHRGGIAQRAPAGGRAVADHVDLFAGGLVSGGQFLHAAVPNRSVTRAEEVYFGTQQLLQQEISLFAGWLRRVDDKLAVQPGLGAGRRGQSA